MNRRGILRWTAYAAGISSFPISLSLLQSCQPTGDISWQPQSLSAEEAKMVDNIAQIILPSDPDIPGSKDVHCAEFVDKLIEDCLPVEDKKNFIGGLSDLQKEFMDTTHISLSDADSETITPYIENLDKSAFSGNLSRAQQSYRQLKDMVLLGYFTSEMVMNEHLNYHSIPGKYIGCIDISADEKAYVDNNVAG